MLRAAALATALAAAPSAAYLRTSWRDLAANPSYSFADYVSEYGKQYGAAEYQLRERIFARALAEIRRHNADESQPYRMGLNAFTDVAPEEMQPMKGLHRGMRFASPPPAGGVQGADLASLPKEVDWRKKQPAVVTPPKNQGGCGSCWAFASTETVESAVAIATGKLFTLAPQELVSCAPNPQDCGGTGGCQGATEPVAFQYVAKVGMTTEANYGYKGVTGSCDQSKVKKAVVGITNYTRLPTNDYAALMHAVATVGPIAISLDASWGAYEEGVFTGSCGTTIDHAVQLVGYGTDQKSGLDYWLVRNSWGGSWGESGYIRMRRFGAGKEPCGTDRSPGSGNGCKGGPKTIQVCGQCGMLSDSSYPTGAFVH
eukprot:TRINITY_DN1674_c0_g1_i2.p2 TRINITY_DN1674_c0_g1~~TRINITY_DN1674_c0_g1_i2.p2  ORF type:complete len:397 (+),score=142.35 TRINITY_DN1674_c0_g1_i2:79-1191(+)